jgi:cytochrome P450
VLLIGAANRDPEMFERPHEFDVFRNGAPHLAFGASTHFCIGATLARLEARIAIPALARLGPVAEKGQSIERWPHRTIRRLKSYRVEIPEGEGRNA